MTVSIPFELNGVPVEADASLETRLVDVLREQFKLTGTKEGCGEGECGACMILLDGQPVLSCITAVGAVRGRQVTTIEGLRSTTGFAVLSQALNDAGAVQCGFCTPGTIVTAYALLRDFPMPDEKTIREALAGNLCRCTGYNMIVEAVTLAAQKRGDAW
ncbi:MAG: (2Fe-2S)-binding protein [Proteobacteria bacterium]|nr:(2Fe-2S)-binding protein [Pseudomonadota bacterium]